VISPVSLRPGATTLERTAPPTTHHQKEHSMSTTTYHVEGMTCGHCVSAVHQEISTLPGVAEVTVDLPTGQVTVTSDRDVPREEIATAVDEAGYQLAS
jgi:copper chaperone